MIKEYWDDVDRESGPNGEAQESEAARMLSRPALMKVLPTDMSSMTALSVGCSDPGPTIEVAKRGARVIVADPSEEALDEAFKALSRHGHSAELVVSRPNQLQGVKDESVDLVTVGSHVTVVPDLEPVFKELRRVLRPRGRVLLIVPHPLLGGGRTVSGQSGRAQWLVDDYFHPAPELPPTHIRPQDELSVEPRMRTLEGYLNPLIAAGFTIERVVEPRPDPLTKGVNNTAWNLFDRIPQLLIIKAVRAD